MINVITPRIFSTFEESWNINQGLSFSDPARSGSEYIFALYFLFLSVAIDSEFHVVYDSKSGDIWINMSHLSITFTFVWHMIIHA